MSFPSSGFLSSRTALSDLLDIELRTLKLEELERILASAFSSFVLARSFRNSHRAMQASSSQGSTRGRVCRASLEVFLPAPLPRTDFDCLGRSLGIAICDSVRRSRQSIRAPRKRAECIGSAASILFRSNRPFSHARKRQGTSLRTRPFFSS